MTITRKSGHNAPEPSEETLFVAAIRKVVHDEIGTDARKMPMLFFVQDKDVSEDTGGEDMAIAAVAIEEIPVSSEGFKELGARLAKECPIGNTGLIGICANSLVRTVDASSSKEVVEEAMTAPLTEEESRVVFLVSGGYREVLIAVFREEDAFSPYGKAEIASRGGIEKSMPGAAVTNLFDGFHGHMDQKKEGYEAWTTSPQ